MNAPPLRDIHLPAEPGLWPLAPGGWAVLALVLAVLAWLAVRGMQLWQRQRRRRALMAEFDAAVGAARSPGDEAAALSSLLRRAARIHHPAAAALAGEDWLRFLDGADAGRAFSQGVGRSLLEAPFRPVGHEIPRERLHALVRARLTSLAEGGDA